MVDISHILAWGDRQTDYVDHSFEHRLGNGEKQAKITLRRYVSTMTPDEIIFVRVIWLLCQLGQIGWPKYLECARVVATSSDSSVLYDGVEQSSQAEVVAVATHLVRQLTSFQRGAHYAGYREAVIAVARHAEPEVLRDYLASQAECLTT